MSDIADAQNLADMVRAQGKARNLLIGVERPRTISHSERQIPGKRELAW